ncbi:hypothetical protein GPECTOR_138g666 [Gonium pectorale]|uniref:Uncharacterized protein n=1 Tax=Gonium pectorale TaxID=33097 RepID=A0A150FZA1_GONPE|nr:hypothetical protein GPECTOR_138g666 [Gonium pectorale]|eukprot:KXZ42535.1 hypothetical protein GPECTOR_138g666 [Gonium pectorale]
MEEYGANWAETAALITGPKEYAKVAYCRGAHFWAKYVTLQAGVTLEEVAGVVSANMKEQVVAAFEPETRALQPLWRRTPFLGEELPELIQNLKPQPKEAKIVTVAAEELYRVVLFTVPPRESLAVHWGPLSASLGRALAYLAERCHDMRKRSREALLQAMASSL